MVSGTTKSLCNSVLFSIGRHCIAVWFALWYCFIYGIYVMSFGVVCLPFNVFIITLLCTMVRFYCVMSGLSCLCHWVLSP